MASKDNNKPKKSPKATKKTPAQDPEAKAPTEPTNRPQALTIVGIGASAGGLAALSAFFNALPADPGMAFVVVTHLHPEHESYMAELLQKYTTMPVQQVMGRVKVEPNHVYVIPPNRSILMQDSHVETSEFDEPHGQRTPIDHFFRSLAQGHSESIAVILSGGGTDGSVGVKDIKEQGGLIFVQHPDDAEFDSMPHAAINTGLADLVLPVAKLAEKLIEFTRHRPLLPHDGDQLTNQDTETLQRILGQVHARTGHDFNQYKRSTILRRVERRMQLNKFITLETYLDFLRQNAGEAQAMFSDILIGVTNFFRDREAWAALEQKVIPAMFDEKEQDQEIRAWSIGCATGEEAYSLAILLFEQAARLDYRPRIQIFASDLDEGSIAHARDALYPAAIEADISSERLERFFTREGEYYRLKRELRDVVLFTNHNILFDPPFSRQHLIVCRNVLIYLQRSVQERLFDIFYYALNQGGYLFLGRSETAEHASEQFEVVDKEHRLYQPKQRVSGRQQIPVMPRTARRNMPSTEKQRVRPHLGNFLEDGTKATEQHQKALEFYGPPSVLVDAGYQILHVSETAGRYLQQPKGPITGDLLKLVRTELQLELRTILFRAFEKDRAIVSRSIPVQFNGHPRQVILSVRPRTKRQANEISERRALVVFLEDETDEPLEVPETQGPQAQAEPDKRIVQLEAEVQRLREQLQVSVEEFKISTEEMNAANEEQQSINEEYLSTTEELETSKEELQSVNEELQSVNSEMRLKLDEISRAQEELENLMGANEIPTLFLDRELLIQRFSAGIQDLFSILQIDRGRHISDLTHKLGYDQFSEDAHRVLSSLVPVEREVHLEDGTAFVIRLRPYRTVQNRIEGVVITFIDITKLKATEQELINTKQTLEDHLQERERELDGANQMFNQTRELFEKLFDTNPIPTSITTLDEGVFVNVNDAYLKYYGLKYEDVIGHSSQELNLPIAQGLRSPLIERVKKDGSLRNIEMETKLHSGESRSILASIQTVLVDNKNALMLAFIDITERVRAEHVMRSASTGLRSSEQKERQRISQILHDELQQNIFAVKVQLSLLAQTLGKNDIQAARTDLQQLDEWLAESISITRQLSIDLSPPVLEGEGLAEALLWLAAQMQKQYGLNVTVEPNGVRADLRDDVRSVVFQCLRELLFNIVKHAGVDKAVVTFGYDHPGYVGITVSDDGKGFDPEAFDRKGSSGLRRMRDRLFIVGANLKIESGHNQGTHITIEAPRSDSIE
ncbi:MAG TPA: chemotaxis protein CheB [Anaerolineales bacterium]|nr:chemotaxis protein CheB [Anaerolineales bacterium]